MVRALPSIVAIGWFLASAGSHSIRQSATPPCIPLAQLRDTMRFVGIPRTELPPGALRIWVDSDGSLTYSEGWLRDTTRFLWEGTIRGSQSEPTAYEHRRARNGVEVLRETVERSGDSLVTVRQSNRRAEAIAARTVAAPSFLPAAVRFALIYCAALRQDGAMKLAGVGDVRSSVVATAELRSGPRRARAQLRLLRRPSGEVIARAWFDASGRAIAMPFVEGEMDLIDPMWVSSRDALLEAEIRASSPNCRSGFGFGTCEPGPRVCNLSTSTNVRPIRVRGVVLADSGYSVRSDGLGPYTADSSNVTVPPVGVVAGILLSDPSAAQKRRAFLVDLTKPVPGDIGKPLGVVTVTGATPGKWAPAGSNFVNELVAHANTDWDQQQHSIASIPVGSSQPIDQLTIDFYIDGVLHALQMGAQPYGHCYAAGTAVYGDGTSTAIASHPDSTRWLVVLPPGSKGRLFRNANGDASAVNLGLYYVSVRMEVQR